MKLFGGIFRLGELVRGPKFSVGTSAVPTRKHSRVLLAILLTLAAAALEPQPAQASETHAATCANLLASGGYKVILKQVAELGIVESPTDPVPLKQLYLKLKDAEWSNPPVKELRATLLASRQKHFAIDTMSEKELRQFYVNAVHALYVRVADLWRTEEVRTQVGPVMNRKLEGTLSQILAQYFSPWGLGDRDLTAEAAREHLRARRWMPLPWQKIAAFLTEYSSFTSSP